MWSTKEQKFSKISNFFYVPLCLKLDLLSGAFFTEIETIQIEKGYKNLFISLESQFNISQDELKTWWGPRIFDTKKREPHQ